MLITARRIAPALIAGLVSLALAAATTLGNGVSGMGTFVLFVVTLPWTLTLYVLTMVFDVTSPIAIGAALALVTLLAGVALRRLIARTCSPTSPDL